MTEENLRSLERLYKQYKMPVKPLLAEIEALYEKFPLALYNEIRAMNDHVARAVTSDDDAEAFNQIDKANSHLRRITRDCYKYLNLWYREESERFDSLLYHIEPQTTEEFKMMAEYGELSDNAATLVRLAKQEEHKASDEETYSNYEKAYNAYKELHDFIDQNRRNVLTMSRKRVIRKMGGIIFSIITFLLGCIITNNNQAIVEVIKEILP